eukprot:1596836-Pyramimonas_sp.AAC.1
MGGDVTFFIHGATLEFLRGVTTRIALSRRAKTTRQTWQEIRPGLPVLARRHQDSFRSAGRQQSPHIFFHPA